MKRVDECEGERRVVGRRRDELTRLRVKGIIIILHVNGLLLSIFIIIIMFVFFCFLFFFVVSFIVIISFSPCGENDHEQVFSNRGLGPY